MNYSELSLKMHEENIGKIEVVSKVSIENRDDLSTAYTPGVAEPCRKIHENKEDVYRYTAKGNLVAVVTDGSAVLGLGNIGPQAAMPVMEGKAVLFKEFANVDAFPICIDSSDVDQIVNTVKMIAPTFGGINLEDIAAPRCFEIEERLKKEIDIPVFHDDQHGTAIVVCAGFINALKLVGKDIRDAKIVVNGAGSAGCAIVKMLFSIGAKNITVCDREGIIYKGSPFNSPHMEELAKTTNLECKQGILADAMKGSDVFIGVSAANVVSGEMVCSMNEGAVVFAMANPTPEIMPDIAKKAGAKVVGSGRSDFANQVNNVLAFPGIFRGALNVRASDINEEMKVAAAYAIANIVKDDELSEDYVIPNALDKRIGVEVAEAVERAARESGVARLK
ncbi:malate dehydrogenase (oxaloacetate-decarboxylating) [Peptoclostridium litorale DSM 5388]|uniref:Malate dehydrogenase n=1 Tax=Peptoclostridium litorale DSM 5388 TaxID=1121324 RepID=A0A069RJL7_PEPLI|nr:malic enzyme-like NAD(P)-binding protein [Peptoclostridium litorale]KDR94442.1 malate dehydrogenase [Peptoclostridium litorale DSM 5388]SIO23829.1 malate dehydrogenase (oxaloacetate-decarboxylating) [Peptoclostridium litorale DSM 5388]